MKFNKILMSLACTALMVGSAACTDEVEYTPAEASPVTKFYFPTTTPLNVDILDGSKSFKLTVARPSSQGEETVAISSSVTPDNPFTIPQSVTFEDGQGTTTLEVAYNIEDLVVNQPYAITIALDGIANTPYSWGTVTIEALYLPWRDFADDESMGIFREDFLTGLLNVGVQQYSVKVQRHPLNDNIYRIVNPYATYPYVEAGVMTYDTAKDRYMIINCEDPEGVYFSLGWTGMSFGQNGEFYTTSYAQYLLNKGNTLAEVKAQGVCGTIKKGIIKMPAQSVLIGFENYNNAGLYLAGNPEGLFKLVLPGYEDEPEWEEIGWCDYTDGLLSPLFGELGPEGTGNKYKVYVERNIEDNTRYRVLNPYGPESGLTDQVPAQPYYLEFMVEDPEFVLMNEVEPDFLVGENGVVVTDMAYFMMEYMNKTAEDVQAAGYGSTFENNVFKIPGDQAVFILFIPSSGQFVNYGNYDEAYQIETVLDLNTAVKSEDMEQSPSRQSIKANYNKDLKLRISPKSNGAKPLYME